MMSSLGTLGPKKTGLFTADYLVSTGIPMSGQMK